MTTMSLDTRFAPVPARDRAPAAAGTVRLTRRGRVVVLLVALVLAFAVGVFVTAASSVATLQPGAPEATEIVQVGSGDTLWGIASELAEDGQVRDMMHRIERLNALESTALQTGQRLVVPAS